MLGHRYELRALLGTGGMAQVWSATDQSLGRVVAIKMLHPHLVSDGASVERFRREAVAVAGLSHPNVVAVFDTIFGDGAEAIVMEYIDGPTLRNVLDDRGTLEPDEVVRLGARLADALAHAHAHGVVHRDIKPANILIARDGTPKITDFGIAKGSEHTDLTVVGTIMGTPSYLAPEHVQNLPVDRRADLYSLCVVLYEALCGRTPFVGDDSTAVALARLHQDPTPLQELVPDLDADLCAVVMRGLERSPDRRFQSAADLETALRTPSSLRPFISAAPTGPPTTAPGGNVAPGVEVASPPARASVVGPVDIDTADIDVAAVDTFGVAPAVFVNDDHDGGDLDRRSRRRSRSRQRGPRRSKLGSAILAVLCLGPLGILGALIWVPLSESTPPTTTADPNPRRALEAASVVSFDPFGDGAEHQDTIAALTDGDTDTAWTTERYNNQQFGTKEGVGFVIDLGDSYDIDEVQFVTQLGWLGSLALTLTDPTLSESVPDAAKAFGAPQDRFGVALNGATARYVTVWITDLGPAISGKHMVSIFDVTVVGRSST